MNRDDLEPIEPAAAVEMYLNARDGELSEKSLTNQRYRLNSFIDWCHQEGIDNMNELTGRDLHKFRIWRKQGRGKGYQEISKITLNGILQTLRVFLEFCASIGAVVPGLREQVLIPDLDPEEESSDQKVSQDYAEALLDHLDSFHYASRDHVIIAILWHTGIRLGTLRALDVGDFNPDDRYFKVEHRPEKGTPLKNRRAAERFIAIDEYHTKLVEDYLEHHRHDVVDDYGREPLITSSQGRLTEAPIRHTLYKWTRPCMIQDCPHGEDPERCEWMDYQNASGCPSSRSPHGMRRGAITRRLREGLPEHVVSDRMNVASDTLEKHYDKRTAFEKMQTRREFMEKQ